MHVDTTIKLVDRCEGFSGILAVSLQTANNLLITAALPFHSCGGIYGGHDTRRSHSRASVLMYSPPVGRGRTVQQTIRCTESDIGYDNGKGKCENVKNCENGEGWEHVGHHGNHRNCVERQKVTTTKPFLVSGDYPLLQFYILYF